MSKHRPDAFRVPHQNFVSPLDSHKPRIKVCDEWPGCRCEADCETERYTITLPAIGRLEAIILVVLLLFAVGGIAVGMP